MSAHNTLQEELLAEFRMVDPGTGKTVSIDRNNAVLSLTTTAAETRIIGTPPRAGLRITIALAVDGGDCVITQTGSLALNQAGNTTMTFNDAGDRATLISIVVGTAFVWRIESENGVSLS